LSRNSAIDILLLGYDQGAFWNIRLFWDAHGNHQGGIGASFLDSIIGTSLSVDSEF
jgi:hypothetical protein